MAQPGPLLRVKNPGVRGGVLPHNLQLYLRPVADLIELRYPVHAAVLAEASAQADAAHQPPYSNNRLYSRDWPARVMHASCLLWIGPRPCMCIHIGGALPFGMGRGVGVVL